MKNWPCFRTSPKYISIPIMLPLLHGCTSYPFFETHPYSVEMMRDYINSINANRGNFFLAFQPNLPGLSGEAAKIFNDWWTNYRKNFELIAVYNIVSGDSGHFMRRPELDIDTSWKPGGSFRTGLENDLTERFWR